MTACWEVQRSNRPKDNVHDYNQNNIEFGIFGGYSAGPHSHIIVVQYVPVQ